MARLELVNYRGVLMTPDTMGVLGMLEEHAAGYGWQVQLARPEEYRRGDPDSLLAAGREVWVTLTHKSPFSHAQAIQALWSMAIPLGFTPKNRYPLAEPQSDVFHYFGPWQGLMHRIMAEGRGDLVWASLCCAAQVDVGVWQGDKKDVRYVQAQLHRIGLNPGVIDGVLEARTKACLLYLGLAEKPFPEILDSLAHTEPLAPPPQEIRRGHLVLPGVKLQAQGFGGLKAWPSDNGVGLEMTGPGRLVVDMT